MQYLLTSSLHAQDADLGDKCQIMLSMGEFCLTAHVDCNGQKLVVKLARDLLTDQPCTGPLLSLTQSNATDRNLQVYFRTDYVVNRLLLCTRITLSCKRFEHPGHAHVLRYVGHDATNTCIFSEAYEGTLHSVMRQPFFRPTCEDTWVNLLGQVLLGLRYLHAVASVYHRNLHPQALVFDTQGHPRNWQWRIADFGGAVVVPTADMEHYALDVVIMVQWLLLERLFQAEGHVLLPGYIDLLLRFEGVPSFRTWGRHRTCKVTPKMCSLVRGLEVAMLPLKTKAELHKLAGIENMLLHEKRQHQMPQKVAKSMTPMHF